MEDKKKIAVPLSANFKRGEGVRALRTWGMLDSTLRTAFLLKENEKLDGLIIDEHGITAFIGTKEQ